MYKPEDESTSDEDELYTRPGYSPLSGYHGGPVRLELQPTAPGRQYNRPLIQRVFIPRHRRQSWLQITNLYVVGLLLSILCMCLGLKAPGVKATSRSMNVMSKRADITPDVPTTDELAAFSHTDRKMYNEGKKMYFRTIGLLSRKQTTQAKYTKLILSARKTRSVQEDAKIYVYGEGPYNLYDLKLNTELVTSSPTISILLNSINVDIIERFGTLELTSSMEVVKRPSG
ncbi:hypothetical protein HHI36_022515 [Cryptolaemus montrouzieri]|uniref:Uncharacterized protein n=1 Tax=Cryptolaemus montrouzieri TaxID=559131 RepID=A0ABD2N023_9CUCU